VIFRHVSLRHVTHISQLLNTQTLLAKMYSPHQCHSNSLQKPTHCVFQTTVVLPVAGPLWTVKLGPDHSCSCSGLWLVCMWTARRAPMQAAQVTRATGSCGSDCCRYMKTMLTILWTMKLARVIKTSSSLAIGSSRVQALRLTELQCKRPL
jgi:hypothetical protein